MSHRFKFPAQRKRRKATAHERIGAAVFAVLSLPVLLLADLFRNLGLRAVARAIARPGTRLLHRWPRWIWPGRIRPPRR